MKQTTDITEDLATGKVAVSTKDEQYERDCLTTAFKGLFGDCDGVCRFDTGIWKWVPEEGCEVHDLGVCDCYPEHCLKPEHGECWCSPEVEIINNSRLTIHQERH